MLLNEAITFESAHHLRHVVVTVVCTVYVNETVLGKRVSSADGYRWPETVVKRDSRTACWTVTEEVEAGQCWSRLSAQDYWARTEARWKHTSATTAAGLSLSRSLSLSLCVCVCLSLCVSLYMSVSVSMCVFASVCVTCFSRGKLECLRILLGSIYISLRHFNCSVIQSIHHLFVWSTKAHVQKQFALFLQNLVSLLISNFTCKEHMVHSYCT